MNIQPIKNLVKIKDYHSYILRQSVIWTNLKNQFLKEKLEKTKENTEYFKSIVQKEVEDKYFLGFKYTSKKEPDLKFFTETEEGKELRNKLALVEQRLELLENEWNRTEYYILYNFEMIEILPELTNSFFSYIMQEMKSVITYN
jgi:hypothetical protein